MCDKSLYKSEEYWEARKNNFYEVNGKRVAAEYISCFIKGNARRKRIEPSVLDIGCGEGHILNYIHQQLCEEIDVERFIGIDKNSSVIKKAKGLYPEYDFYNRDVMSCGWTDKLGDFDVIYMINILHEVFSSCYCNEENQIDVESGKLSVAYVIGKASKLIKENGILVIFDGIESLGDNNEMVSIIVDSEDNKHLLDRFQKEYNAYKISISYARYNDQLIATLSKRDLVRFITKKKWMVSQLWEDEKKESYQYYNECEFLDVLTTNNLKVLLKKTFDSDRNLWQPKFVGSCDAFMAPEEHILIVGKNVV